MMMIMKDREGRVWGKKDGEEEEEAAEEEEEVEALLSWSPARRIQLLLWGSNWIVYVANIGGFHAAKQQSKPYTGFLFSPTPGYRCQ